MKKTAAPTNPPSSQEPARITALEQELDERDETIRLLNEALSRALDELAAIPEAA